MLQNAPTRGKTLAIGLVALTLCSASAFAEKPTRGQGGLLDAQEVRAAAVEVLGQYRDRLVELERSAASIEKEREAVLGQLYAELDGVMALGTPPEKSSSCAMACTKMTTGLVDIANAEGLAKDSWIASCPTSSNASDAFVFAHNSEFEANSVKSDVCSSPPVCNDAEIKSARDLALDAWIAAYDAYSDDGCDADMQSAAFAASDAYVDFHNARYYCNFC